MMRPRIYATLMSLAAITILAPAQVITSQTTRSRAVELVQRARREEAVRSVTRLFCGSVRIAVPELPRTMDFAPDYYEAYAYRIWDRTYPADTVVPNAYREAALHRLAMPGPPREFTEGGPKINGAGLWEFIGPKKLPVPYTTYYGPIDSITSGRIGGIAFDPTDSNTIYMTGSAGGILKTTDGGANWSMQGDGIPYPYAGPIAVCPTDRNVVLVGTGDYDGGLGTGYGVMRSVDGGGSWEWVASNVIQSAAFSAIVFDPDNSNRILASTSRGIWKSENQGLTWAQITTNGNLDLNFSALSVGKARNAGGRLYVASCLRQGSGVYGVYYSTDLGATWSRDANFPVGTNMARLQITTSAVDGDVVYAVQGGVRKVFRGVFNGSGFTWTDITGNFPNGFDSTNTYNWSQQSYDMHISAAAHTVNGNVRDDVYVGLITIAAWDGTTWKDIGLTYTGGAKTHNDQHCFAVSPSNSNQMAFGNDGGIYRLAIDGAGNHTIDAKANGNTSFAMFYTGAWHPSDATRMIGGTQDNASPAAIGDLSQWANRTGGDGCGCAIAPLNPLIGFGSAQYQYLYSTSDGWQTNQFLRSNWPENMPFVGRMTVDASAENYLYVGGTFSVFRYAKNTNTWTDRLGGSPFNSAVRAITVARSDPNFIYVGTTGSGLYVSTDRGLNWRRIGESNFSGSVTSIAVHPSRPYEILFTLGNSPNHVRRCADVRLATPIFTSVSGTGASALPNIFTSYVALNLDRPDTDYYVATDSGVFGTRDSGTTWFKMTEPLGMPACEVTTLEHTPGTGYLNAATYGRGMFRINVDQIPTSTTLKMSAKTERKSGSIIYVAKVANTGTEAARKVQIRDAVLTFAGASPLLPVTAMPLNIGRIGVGTSDSQTITFNDAALTVGRMGLATITVTWLSGSETKSLTFTQKITLP